MDVLFLSFKYFTSDKLFLYVQAEVISYDSHEYPDLISLLL